MKCMEIILWLISIINAFPALISHISKFLPLWKYIIFVQWHWSSHTVLSVAPWYHLAIFCWNLGPLPAILYLAFHCIHYFVFLGVGWQWIYSLGYIGICVWLDSLTHPRELERPSQTFSTTYAHNIVLVWNTKHSTLQLTWSPTKPSVWISSKPLEMYIVVFNMSF